LSIHIKSPYHVETFSLAPNLGLGAVGCGRDVKKKKDHPKRSEWPFFVGGLVII